MRLAPDLDRLREECGVFGVYSVEGPAAPIVHLGLISLQHRGQESAGIAASERNPAVVPFHPGIVSYTGWPSSP